MTSEIAPADVQKAIQALVVAEKTNIGIEVTLPVAFGVYVPLKSLIFMGVLAGMAAWLAAHR